VPVEAAGARLSALDTDRFGVVTARADEVTKTDIEALLDYCESHGVELLIARSRVEDVAATQALEDAGCGLMDTLVYYERELSAGSFDATTSGQIELLAPGDVEQVEAIARECFEHYSGHYHADPRLDRTACREVYASWARACCTAQGPDDFVLVAGDRGYRVGFSCFRRSSSGEGELLLGAVRPGARGQGLYTQLTLAGMKRLQAAGATRFVTSTHLSNWSAQSAWVRAGLRPYRAYHTFHRWFDRMPSTR
jgi:ribosomal protein S18 acetylase RimI-like enzyme